LFRHVLGIVNPLLAVFLAAILQPAVRPADRDEKDLPSAQPNVNILPRIRVKSPDATESIADRRADIRVDTTLVLIPVAVTDPMSRFVTGLERESFKVFEDKVEQEIVQFSSEDAPLSVGIALDTSGSMGAKLQKSRQAVAQFMKTANPQDEFFLIQFSDRPEIVQDFTKETEEIQNQLTFVQSKGTRRCWTPSTWL
jgi:Ca-activated chloride channel family protein